MIEELIKKGLSLIAGAVSKKGVAWLKDKTGVDLSAGTVSSEDAVKLKQYELDHETELAKILAEQDQTQLEEVTKRWQADMVSDSWMSKNIRPLVLGAITACVIGGLFVTSVAAAKFSEICSLATIIYLAYFGARTTEKGVVANAISAWKGGK